MMIETLPVGPLQVNCYLLVCEVTRQAAVIDPGDEGERIVEAAKAAGCDLQVVINTHGHFDHIGANAHVVAMSGAELMMHADDVPLLKQAATHASIYGLNTIPSPEPTRLLAEGDSIMIGEIKLDVLHVPGHSPGGICLVANGDVFVGDALFAGSIGRTDLPGGSHDQLIAGIKEKLLPLPDDTIVHPGHGPDTTIGQERLNNPFLN